VGIIEYFGAEFLCRLVVTDIQHLLAKAEEYVFPGILGSIYCIHWYNDINVLNQSTLFVTYHTPEVSFIVNGHEHHMRYYLVDATYSSWSVFHKGCVPSSTREVSILLNEIFNVEERCGVCCQPTEEEVQHTKLMYLFI
jgi:hypothetical protein